MFHVELFLLLESFLKIVFVDVPRGTNFMLQKNLPLLLQNKGRTFMFHVEHYHLLGL